MAEINRQRWLVFAFHSLTLLLLGLHLAVRFLPPTPTPIPSPSDAEAAWWGLWPASYPPNWTVAIAAILIVGAVAWFWWREISEHPAAVHVDGMGAGKQRTMAVLVVVSAVLAVVFFGFPVVHTRWGDAYMLAKSIAWPDPALRLTHSWQAPIDVFLHSQLWLILSDTLGWQEDATPVYRMVSPIAGAFYLLIVLLLARDERLAPPWLTYGLLASLGLIQLFFGYIENYSLAAVGTLAYLWLGISVLRRDRPLWLAASVLAITHATHPSTIVLAPSLLYLGWRAYVRDRGRVRSGLFVLLQMVLPMLVVALATVLLMEQGGHGLAALFTSDRPGGGDARLFVPVWETTTRWEHYTLFSWPHLRDFLNEQLLVAPVVLPSLLILGVYFLVYSSSGEDAGNGTKNAASATMVIRFLLLSSVLYWLFVWFWNPDYGGQRDWDLFSLSALPSTLLLIALLPTALIRRWYLLMGATPLILVQSLHTVSWIYQNTLPWSWP